MFHEEILITCHHDFQDGLAVRCWPELPGPVDQGGLDQWCYMALARLASEGNLDFFKS